MNEFGEYIDASRYTRAESVSRLDYGPRWDRNDAPPKWGQNPTTWVV